MSKNKYQGINPYVVNQVRYHAYSLMRHSAIHGVEVEDLEQELMLDYLSRKQAYDPEKAKPHAQPSTGRYPNCEDR